MNLWRLFIDLHIIHHVSNLETIQDDPKLSAEKFPKILRPHVTGDPLPL